MKKVNRILFFLLLVLFLIPFKAMALSETYDDKLHDLLNVEEEKEKINIYFFYGNGCPHCAHEEEFFTKLEDKYGEYYNLYTYETWNSKDNSDLMKRAKEIMGDTVSTAVPYTVIGTKSFTGYGESTGRKIEQTIIDYYEIENNNGKPIVDENKETLPLLGEIDKKDVSIGLVAIVLGLVDGFNPCAMWILLFLINMLIGMNDKKKMLLIGTVFLFTSAVMYFLFMLGITNILSFISVPLIRRIIGALALILGAYNIYKFIKQKNEADGCHVVNENKRKKIFTRIRQFTTEKNIFLALAGVIILAVSVNVVELACSSVFPATFAEILAINNVDGFLRIIYLIIYTLFYMIDDLIVFVIAVATLQLSTTSTKYGKYSTIVGGIIMLTVGLLLIFKPEWLMLNF